MKLQAALFLVFLVGATLAQEEATCQEKIFHLLDRIYYAQTKQLSLEEYKAIYAYVEDRLLHNKTYTKCYNYTNEMCQLATTQLLPKFIHYVKENAQNVSSAKTDYHYLKHMAFFFLNRCGLGYAPNPDIIEAEEFNRATCRKSAERFYGFLTSVNKVDIPRLHQHDYFLLFRSFSTMLHRAHERVCFNPLAYTPRVLFINIRDFILGKQYDRHILVELWKLISYMGVEYLKDAGLNQNVTQVCDFEVDAARNYLSQTEGFTYFKPFSEHMTSLLYQTKCFKRTKECKAFRSRLSETFLNSTFVPYDAEAFSHWWSIIRFNVKQFIYDCYFHPKLDWTNPIWTSNYTYDNANCTARINATVKALRGTFLADVKNTNVSSPVLHYLRRELNEVSDQCFSTNQNCSNYKVFVNHLVNSTLGTKNFTRDYVTHSAEYDETFNSNFFLVQINALKWIHHCTKKASDVIIPKESEGCTRYVAQIRDVIQQATNNKDFVQALVQVRESKKLVELYKDCNIEKGASKLCLDLSEQIRELYIKTLFTNEAEAFKQKLRMVGEALKDVTEECKALKPDFIR